MYQNSIVLFLVNLMNYNILKFLN